MTGGEERDGEQRVGQMGRRQRGDGVVERPSSPLPRTRLGEYQVFSRERIPPENGYRRRVRHRGFFLDLAMHCGHLSGWIVQ